MRQQPAFGRRDAPDVVTRKLEPRAWGVDYRNNQREPGILDDIRTMAFRNWKNTIATISLSAAAVLVAAAMMVPAPVVSPEEREHIARIAAEKEYERDCGQRQVPMAFIKLQRPITARLRAPSTASFPYAPVIGEPIGKCRFRIVSYVDAQNAFGGTVRTYWSGVIEYNRERRTWRALDVQMDG